MTNSHLPLIGLAVASFFLFGPGVISGPSPSTTDSMDESYESWRIAVADLVVEFKNDRTDKTKQEFKAALEKSSSGNFKSPTLEIFGLWWNKQPEEARRRILERELGKELVSPND